MSLSEPFFNTDARLADLEAAGHAWVGTPFAHNGQVRGRNGGAACHGLVWGVLAEAGWDAGEPMPLGRVGHARHSTEEIMLDWLRARPGMFAEIVPATVAALRPGDLTTHRLGLSSHHVALVLPGDLLLEVWSRRPAAVRSLGDADTTKRMTGIFRPLRSQQG
jgi:hypothetical protein